MTLPPAIEQQVLDAARAGEVAHLWPWDVDDRQQVLRAELLVDLLTSNAVGPDGKRAVHPRGVRIVGNGVLLSGQLDLSYQQAHVPLELTDCRVEKPPVLTAASLPAFELLDCNVPGVLADRVRVEHHLALEGCLITGSVRLLGARIGGDLKCSGTRLNTDGVEGVALEASRAIVTGSMHLAPRVSLRGEEQRCQVTGSVRLLGAQIGGQLDCSGARLHTDGVDGVALQADSAVIAGGVFLESFVSPNGEAQRCEVIGSVRLIGAQVGGLYCSGARLIAPKGEAAVLFADSADVAGAVVFGPYVSPTGETQRCEVTGSVRLLGARVGFQVDCSGARLEATGVEETAIVADHLTVTGGMFLQPWVSPSGEMLRCEVTGQISLLNAHVSGLYCSGARLNAGRDEGVALNATNAVVIGNVDLQPWVWPSGDVQRCEVNGTMMFLGARVGGELDCRGARLDASGIEVPVLNADSAVVTGGVFLQPWVSARGEVLRTEVTGEVRLIEAQVGSMDCSGVHLHSKRYALTLNRTEIKGNLLLGAYRPETEKVKVVASEVQGQILLRGARILGRLDADGAHVQYPDGAQLHAQDRGALLAEQAQINGDVRLRSLRVSKDDGDWVRCRITGGVILKGVRIGGALRCDGAELRSGERGAAALSASGAEITDAVFLRGIAVEGPGPQLDTENLPCTVIGDLRFTGSRIGGRLDLRGATITGAVSLAGCRTGELVDDLVQDRGTRKLIGCWSNMTSLNLDGFAYERISGPNTDFPLRRDWLRREWLPRAHRTYSPGPWDQLQRAYAHNGQDEEARLAAIAKQQHRIDEGDLRPLRRLWRQILGWTIGYGYRPARAGGWAILAIIALTIVVWVSPESQLVPLVEPPTGLAVASSPTSDGWTALSYSIDVFIPVGDFNVAGKWQAQGWLEMVRLLFVALGWLLGTLFIAGFTRIVRG